VYRCKKKNMTLSGISRKFVVSRDARVGMQRDQFLVRHRGMNVRLGNPNNYAKNIYQRELSV
jgi:hypothetical protein